MPRRKTTRRVNSLFAVQPRPMTEAQYRRHVQKSNLPMNFYFYQLPPWEEADREDQARREAIRIRGIQAYGTGTAAAEHHHRRFWEDHRRRMEARRNQNRIEEQRRQRNMIQYLQDRAMAAGRARRGLFEG